MAMSLVADFSKPLGLARTNVTRQPDPAPRPASSVFRQYMANAAGIPVGRPARIGGKAGGEYVPLSPPGVIGAAVIRAARRSAGLARRRLARMLAVSQGTVLGWEDGTTPLFCVPYAQLRALADALTEAGARVGWELDELLIASQCDLLVTGMLHGFEDYAEVSPIEGCSAEAWAARGLLRWAPTGTVPMRYRPYASSNPLLARTDMDFFASVARDLQEGLMGDDLTGFGHTLEGLIKAADQLP